MQLKRVATTAVLATAVLTTTATVPNAHASDPRSEMATSAVAVATEVSMINNAVTAGRIKPEEAAEQTDDALNKHGYPSNGTTARSERTSEGIKLVKQHEDQECTTTLRTEATTQMLMPGPITCAPLAEARKVEAETAHKQVQAELATTISAGLTRPHMLWETATRQGLAAGSPHKNWVKTRKPSKGPRGSIRPVKPGKYLITTVTAGTQCTSSLTVAGRKAKFTTTTCPTTPKPNGTTTR